MTHKVGVPESRNSNRMQIMGLQTPQAMERDELQHHPARGRLLA